jgi:hypothetical protein
VRRLLTRCSDQINGKKRIVSVALLWLTWEKGELTVKLQIAPSRTISAV